MWKEAGGSAGSAQMEGNSQGGPCVRRQRGVAGLSSRAVRSCCQPNPTAVQQPPPAGLALATQVLGVEPLTPGPSGGGIGTVWGPRPHPQPPFQAACYQVITSRPRMPPWTSSSDLPQPPTSGPSSTGQYAHAGPTGADGSLRVESLATLTGWLSLLGSRTGVQTLWGSCPPAVSADAQEPRCGGSSPR